MAKKRQKTTRFSIQGFDLNHYRTTEQYAAAVQALFDRVTLAMAESAARRKIDSDKPFSFDDYPEVKAELKKIVGQLATQLQTTIESGSKNQWLFACEKNDGFIASIMDTSKLSKARLKKMQDRNLDALSTFQGRKVGGMDLSQRVWRYVGQYRDQLETALDVGLGEGRSAQELARDVKKNLRDPDRLFRRVRDKRGNLVLSKAARAFHPGQGVYRSSVKNAQRLTRSEINMAYRESDFLRWQQLDFVVGFEIHRSNHEPLCKCKMCDRLQGRYPKTFKFKGWHPQCMCYAVPILMEEETFDENELGDLKAALRGTEYKKKQSRNLVTDVPDGFKEWVAENMEASAGWASTPYFIKDNFVDGDLSKGLKIALPTVEPDAPDVPEIPLFEAKTPQEAVDYILANIAESCSLEIKPKDLPLVNAIINQVNQRMQAFGLPKFNNFGKPRNPKAEASWMGHDNSFNVNLPRLSGKVVWNNAQKWAKKGIKWTHFVNEDDVVRQTIDHEIGHCLMSKFGFSGEVMDAFARAGKTRNGIVEINDILGYYASTNEEEYFAEAFAMFMGADRDKMGEVTAEMMKKFVDKVKAKIGRDPFAVPGKEAPKPDPVQAQLDALMPSIESARKIAEEWGLELRLKGLDAAVAAKDVKDINKFISLITSEGTKYTTELSAFFKDAAQLIKDINAAGVDVLPDVVAELTQYMTNLSADKSMWADGSLFYKSELEKAKDKLRQYKASPEARLSVYKKGVVAQVRDSIKTADEWGVKTTTLRNLLDSFLADIDNDTIFDKMQDEMYRLDGRVYSATKKADKFITDAEVLIKEADALGVDSTELRKQVFYLRGGDRAYSWANFKRDRDAAFTNLQAKVEEAKKNKPKDEDFSKMEEHLSKSFKVNYNAVSELPKPLAETEIIGRVGGGDLTQGSCSSLAFTYCANRIGLNVLDFRDGESRRFFSRTRNIAEIARKLGGVVEESKNNFTVAHKLLKMVEIGKEYYFTCGQHAAVVRRTATGLEFLELQSATSNGWKPLNDTVLKYRFGAKKSCTRGGFTLSMQGCLIELSLFKGNSGFKKIMGYINTAESEQKKGSKGTTK